MVPSGKAEYGVYPHRVAGILAGYIGPKIMGRPEEAKRTKAAMQIKGLETALNLYKLDNGSYPSTEQGLIALVELPESGKLPPKWREGGYLDKRKVPKDPWGNDFVYLSPGVNNDFDLSSYGPDGESGGEGRGSKAGFTLMEMLVVLLLLGALFTLAIPSMRTALLDDELLKSSRRLVGALREARERAVGEHKPYLLHFDLGQNTFSYELEGSTTPADERKKPLQLTGSVRIVDVQTPSQEKKSSGVVTLW
ncbi:unnamed protein product, partial [Cyprideis torosa]